MKDSPLSLQGASRRTASETEKLSLWEKVLWVVFCFFALLMMFVYHGVEMTSFGTPTASVDYTMLCWAEKWSGFELSYVAVITSIFLILMVLCLASRKAFLFLFFSLFMALQLYNNVVITDRLRGEYKLSEADAREALEIDAFVRQNPDAVFLVLESGSSTKDGLKITFSSKLSDTFLNQKNTLRVTGGDLLRMQEEGETREIRLSETALPIWRDKSSQASYPVQSVDYLIVPLDAAFYPDLTMCTEVDLGKGNYYKVYHLNDPDLLPRLYSPASLKSGHSVFSLDTGRKHTEPGFLSEYMDENENAVHTSGKDPGYALFGPKTTLQPGDYTVTIYLSNTEYPDEIVIGFTELASANMDLSDTMRDFHQGTASVKYQLHLTEPCEGFEIQVYTWVGGVTVEKVAVDYAPAEPET